MALEEIAVPAVSAAAGGLSTAWLAKVMLQRWLSANDKAHEKWESKIGDLLLLVTRIDEKVQVLRESADRQRETERSLAVLERGFEDVRNNINGLGKKVRDLANQ